MALWEDREIRFCVSSSKLHIRNGEIVIDVFPGARVVETIGVKEYDYVGKLILTNLRIMWIRTSDKSLNMTLGHHCITNISFTSYQSKIQGTSRGVKIKAKGQRSYLFIFVESKDHVNQVTQMLSKISATNSAYTSSQVYRNLMLRSAIITEDNKLALLPKEEIFNTIDGCWNLSGGFGNLGTLIISNIRFVWFSHANRHYNGSIPYIRMNSIAVTNTRYGETLVVKLTHPYADLVFAFQIKPMEKLKTVANEILSMRNLALKTPVYGVFVEPNSDMDADILDSSSDPIICEEDTAINKSFHLNFLISPLLDPVVDLDRKPNPPVYSEELGIAVETPPQGYSLERLWKVL